MNMQDFQRYADLLPLPHPVSTRHRPMNIPDRAAQFSPFAALVGLDDAISETGKNTAAYVEFEGRARELLDHELMLLHAKRCVV